MAYTHKEGSFTLSENRHKEKDTHPDLKGEGTLNGKPAEIAAWRREWPKGGEYLSIKISEKRAVAPGSIKRPEGDATEAPQPQDDVPF